MIYGCWWGDLVGAATFAVLIGGPSAAFAHLHTPYARLGEVLDAATAIALVEVVEETHVSSQEARTQVARIDALVGEVPSRFEFIQSMPHVQRLARGRVLVLPLSATASGRLRSLAELPEPLYALRGDGPALREGLITFRGRDRSAGSHAAASLALTFSLLQSPTSTLRRLGLEGVTAALLLPDGQDAPDLAAEFAKSITDPKIALQTRIGMARLIGRLRPVAGARALSLVLASLPEPALALAVARVIAPFDTPTTRSALDACALRPARPIASVCRTLRARSSVGPP